MMTAAHLAQHDPDRLLTAKEAAALCALSVYTFNEKARAGLIKRARPGKGRMGIRYRRQDVLQYINSVIED